MLSVPHFTLLETNTGAVEPIVPKLSRLTQDKQHFSDFVDNVCEELGSDKEIWGKTREFVLGHLKPYRPETDFTTLAQYISYVRSSELRALSGDLVKSFAELDIANFLFFNGVNFEYEKRYPHEKKRYEPDFHLTDYDIWIEHFGIDKNGGTAPFINRDTYHKEMSWKRRTHDTHNTKLLETFSWQKSDGILTRELHAILKAEGVKFVPRSQAEISKAIKKVGYTTQLSNLIQTFLEHYKSNQMTAVDLFHKARNSRFPTRASAFARVFEFFYEKYQTELDSKKPREIDFNDMITSAVEHIENGRFTVPWRYIIVDEFQDISVGRYRLLEAMLKFNDNLNFFAVGDDWQSIYRFAGSDISIMNHFRDYFGRATVVKLDKTFRFNDRIASVSSKFIQKTQAKSKRS